MNVNRVTSSSKVTSIYGKNKIASTEIVKKSKGDSLEISSIGKSLSSYSADFKEINSKEKIEEIRKEVSMGTYNRDSKLVAKKIIDAMKIKEIK